jgi:hypothetical protein
MLHEHAVEPLARMLHRSKGTTKDWSDLTKEDWEGYRAQARYLLEKDVINTINIPSLVGE